MCLSHPILSNFMIDAPESISHHGYEMNYRWRLPALVERWHSLYREVIIRRLENLTALLRTLERGGKDLGGPVKKLMISCVMPFGTNDTTLFEDTVKRVIKNCPSLLHFVLDPSCHPLDVRLRMDSISDGPSNVTHLDWGYCLRLARSCLHLAE